MHDGLQVCRVAPKERPPALAVAHERDERARPAGKRVRSITRTCFEPSEGPESNLGPNMELLKKMTGSERGHLQRAQL